ncbi:MAG TPA: thymidine kinase [Bacillota bacterium]
MLIVYTGPMFSEKTTALVRECRRAERARKRVISFKYDDRRYSHDHITSHDAQKIPAVAVRDSTQMLEELQRLGPADVILVDEAQFFDEGIVPLLNWLARHHRVVVAGLDLDRFGQPFGPMPALLATADEIHKLKAVCSICGDEAWISAATEHNTSRAQVEIGGADKYTAVCRRCSGVYRHGPRADLGVPEAEAGDD